MSSGALFISGAIETGRASLLWGVAPWIWILVGNLLFAAMQVLIVFAFWREQTSEKRSKHKVGRLSQEAKSVIAGMNAMIEKAIEGAALPPNTETITAGFLTGLFDLFDLDLEKTKNALGSGSPVEQKKMIDDLLTFTQTEEKQGQKVLCPSSQS